MKKVTLVLVLMACSLLVQAQGTLNKGARTWKTISSLMGVSIEKAKTTLTSHGMKVHENVKDEKTGIESFRFIPSNSTDPEYETPYILMCSAGKVVGIYVQYAYEENTSNEAQDLEDISGQIKLGGYTLSKQETKMLDAGMGESEFEVYYFKNKLIETRIYHDKSMANFVVSVGETKYQLMMHGE